MRNPTGTREQFNFDRYNTTFATYTMAHRRRQVGVGALKKKQAQQQRYADVGSKLASSNFEHVQGELESFKANLEEFAQKHKADINRNPEFRRQFQKMCTRIGVDPLRSNKGFWADVLGSACIPRPPPSILSDWHAVVQRW